MSDNRDIFMLVALRENILHTFYQIIWEKAQRTHHNNTPCAMPNVRIPDTVILSHSRIADWFFTSREGDIKKKGHAKLTSANVLEQFEKRTKKNLSPCAALLLQRDASKEIGLQARHIDMAGVRAFLTEGTAGGTLQTFVEPKAESTGIVHNNELSLNWTPNVFYVEKKTNGCCMAKDAKLTLQERCTVEETAKNVKVAPLVSSRITAQLETVCQELALHMETVFGVRLASINLCCKLDAHDTLWVMYCSGLRVSSLKSSPQPHRTLTVDLAGSKAVALVTSTQQQDNNSREVKENVTTKGTGHQRSGKFDEHPTNDRTTSERRGRISSFVSMEDSGNTDAAGRSGRRDTNRAGRQTSPSMRSNSPYSEDSDTASSVYSQSSPSQPPMAPATVGNLRRRQSMLGGGVGNQSAAEESIECNVCGTVVLAVDARSVPKRHVLFPLSLISFFEANPPGTRYVDVVESSREPQAVPEFVKMIHPTLSLAEYRLCRRQSAWLSTPIALCDQCGDGLQGIVAQLVLERDGSIRVPKKQQHKQPQHSAPSQISSTTQEVSRSTAEPHEQYGESDPEPSQDLDDEL